MMFYSVQELQSDNALVLHAMFAAEVRAREYAAYMASEAEEVSLFVVVAHAKEEGFKILQQQKGKKVDDKKV